jgi:hypothetical protein
LEEKLTIIDLVKKMSNTIILIILAVGIGIYQDTNKPIEYELSMEDGSHLHVVLQKNSQYACPLYCDIDHIHHAVMCADYNQLSINQSVYHISEKNENGISLYCSTRKILSMVRFIPRSSKDEIPDIVSASVDE